MNILILGHSKSGKTTAAKMIAKMLKSPPPRNCSDFIIEDFADEKAKTPMDKLNLVKQITSNKNQYRQDLFNYGLKRQAKDPAYPATEALRHTNVVTGIRTPQNLAAARDMFNLVLWVDRIAAKPGSTDKLGPKDADATIDNNGTFGELEDNLRMALIQKMV